MTLFRIIQKAYLHISFRESDYNVEMARPENQSTISAGRHAVTTALNLFKNVIQRKLNF